MPVDLSSALRQVTIPGYRVGSPLSRRPREGAAYNAWTEDGRSVELWVVTARNGAFVRGFLDDAKALAELRRDHLPRVVDYGEADEAVYLATEPTHGATLDELIREGGAIAPMRAVRVLGEVADALDAAHEAGLRHPWLASSSVVVEERPLERAVLQGLALGHQGSPEEGIRAFARLMFECFTGSPPAGAPASAVRPGLPEDLDAALARGLSHGTGRRPASAADLVAEAAKAVIAVAPARPASGPAAGAPAPLRVPGAARERAPLRRRLARVTVPLALAVVVVAAAGVGGWLIGKPDSEAEPPETVSSGTIDLRAPAGWRAARPPRRLGGLSMEDGISAAGGADGRMDAGLVNGTLPSRLGGRVARKPGSPDAVRLGELQAYVWRDVAERGSGSRITLFAAGTDRGIVALACRGGASPRARCEAAAGSLAVPTGTSAALGELDAWTARLDRVVRRLARRRHRDRAKLRAAKTPSGLAGAAGRLARDYSAARRSLAADRAPTGAGAAQHEVERSLRGIGASYRRLARAARRQRGARYRAARRSITRREQALQRTLRRL